jgi:hypothetical protein
MVEQGVPVTVAMSEATRSLREAQIRQRREAKAARMRLREAAARTPIDWRSRHAPGVAQVPTTEPGVAATQVLLPIEAMAVEERQPPGKPQRRTRDIVAMLETRGVIGLIHVKAARALLDDAETATGARQPREMTRGGSGSDLCHMDVQMWCSGRIREVKAAIEATGPLAWPVVKAVVLDARTLSAIAGSRRTRDTRPWIAALTEGLMAAARAYKMVE